MSIQKAFLAFLKDVVNLNDTRVDTAELGIETMQSFISNNEPFKSIYIVAKPQGSFRQETIIRPTNEDLEFDVDLLVEVEEVPDWNAQDYLLNLQAQFEASDRYRRMVKTKDKERCITINYASDFHIDVVPMIKTNEGCKIMNRDSNEYELTDGDGYAKWFAEKNRITGSKQLTKIVRLVKYIRDYQNKFEIKSILLTTLLGSQVLVTDNTDTFSNLPTTFVVLIARLDGFLQANESIPEVKNPVLIEEDFNRKWNQESYAQFRGAIHELSALALEAHQESDTDLQNEKWQKIFGEKFKGEDIKSDSDLQVSNEEKAIVRLADYSHREVPAWPKALQGKVEIMRCRVTGRGIVINIGSNAWPIVEGLNLDYFAEVEGISEPYSVWWQVVNTGSDAASVENGLRGKFEKPKNLATPLQQHETSNYTGTHWIQCYIEKDGYLVAESKPFYLNVYNKKRSKSKKFR